MRLKKITLFGSRARGDYRPDSDYDILVEFDEVTDDKIKEWRKKQEEVFLGVRLDIHVANTWTELMPDVIKKEGKILWTSQ